MAVWEALEPRSRPGVDLGRSFGRPLVGREQELTSLVDALGRTRRDRSPQLVTLVGVPGIGKSRLVRELYERVDADPELIFWRQGRCLPYGDGVSFWALGEMVRAHAGVLETDSAEQAEEKLVAAVRATAPSEADWVLGQLRPLVGLAPSGDRSERRDEAFAAWRRFLESLAEEGPLVLVFEDLHWADDALLDFVDGLVDRARGVGMLVLCTARPELLARRTGWGGGKANALTITLSPLSAGETARLVSALLEQVLLPEEVQTRLLARAEGNPLFAEEYVRMLQDRGFLHHDGGSWRLARSDLPLPETVQGIIAARLDALAPEEKALIQDAAVLGKLFWAGALSFLGGRESWSVEETLHRLERRELLRRERRSSVGGETEYAFHHVLVRDVAYGQIPRGARAQKHLLAAAWIEGLGAGRSTAHAELLAHHYLAALGLRPGAADDPELAARARTVLREAGDAAWAVGAYGSAVGHYGAALDLWPEGSGRGSLLLRHGEALFATERVGGRERLLEARDVLLAEGRLGEAAEAELMIAEGAFDAGDGIRGIEHLRRAVELVEHGDDDRSKAFVLGWGAWRLDTAGDDRERVVELAEEGLRVARSLGSPELEALTLNGLGLALAGAGSFERCFRCLEEALRIARNHSPFHTIRAVGNLAAVVEQSGDLRRARALHEEGHGLALEYGVGFATLWLELELLIDRSYAGEWDSARPELDAYLADEERAPYFMDAPVAGTRALMRLAGGDVDGALADAARSLQRARESVEQQVLCPALAVSARCLLEAGRVAEATACADEVAAIVRRGPDVPPYSWFLDLAVVLDVLGRSAEVEELVGGLGYETPWTRAATLLAGGEPGAAADVLAEIGSLPDEAWARLQSGDEEQIRRALAFYRSVGATRYAALAETSVRTSRSA